MKTLKGSASLFIPSGALCPYLRPAGEWFAPSPKNLTSSKRNKYIEVLEELGGEAQGTILTRC